jgi:hypothetical protein
MGAECYESLPYRRLQYVLTFDQTRKRLTRQTDGWNRDSHQMTKNHYGTFEITLPAINGQPAIPHDSKVKVGESKLNHQAFD